MAAPFQIPDPQQYMPRTAPVEDDEPDEQDGDDYARVSRYIDSILEGEEPTAPTPESVRLTPWQAAAAALNPQSASNVIGLASQPVEARNLAAQREFEKQMDQRDRALTAATSLINARTRGRQTRGQIRLVEDPTTGEPSLQEFLPDGYGGFVPGDILAASPDVVRYLASPTGYHPVSGKTGKSLGGPAQAAGGGTIFPPPPAGVTTQVAQAGATLGGLDELWGAYQKVREETAGKGELMDSIRQRIGTFAGETRLGGAIAPEYARYIASRRAALNAYIKAQTGAQFSVKELERYESQYPEPWDPPDLAQQKLDVLRQRVIADMEAKIRTFPGVGGAAPKQRSEIDKLADEMGL